ncbi:MAG TPA: hypothetical protein VK111_08900 [Virgibacillus sp.]|nr:hypothetical protein [Virgibacillus sp.]
MKKGEWFTKPVISSKKAQMFYWPGAILLFVSLLFGLKYWAEFDGSFRFNLLIFPVCFSFSLFFLLNYRKIYIKEAEESKESS